MTSDATVTSPYGFVNISRKIKKLSELCEEKDGIQTGPFGSQLHSSDYVEVGTPIITVEHLGENIIEGKEAPLVHPDDVKRLIKYTLKEGDIVFSRVGSVDRRAMVRSEQNGWMFSGRLLRVRAKPELVDPAYLSYFFGLPMFKTYIRSIAVGATMPSLNTSLLSDLPIILPEILEQKAIAKTLTSLDEKIRINRELSITLESIAQTIFKSWFVDFDPIKAKMAGKKPEGMDEATAALFPDSMEESDLGLIPKSWKASQLKSALVLHKSTIKAGIATESVPYVPIDNIDSKDFFLRKSMPGSEAKTSLVSFKKNDILFGAMRPYFHKVCLAPFDGTTRTTTFVLRPINPSYLAFSLLAAFQDNAVAYATNHSQGTTIPYAVWNNSFENYPLVLPSESVAAAYNRVVLPLIEYGYSLEIESQKLLQIRDSLLPRLISGELEISEEMLAS